MRLEEKHKTFVVQAYAQFMKRSEIVEAFMEEFNDEIYQLCKTDVSSIKDKDLTEVDKYFAEHGIPITETQGDEYAYGIGGTQIESLKFMREIHIKQDVAKAQLSANFRRLNITHPQFPEKYRELFNKTREEYLANYRSAHLSIPENVILELETLYELTKELAFEQRDLKHIAQAVQILKTIATCNALNQQQKMQDVEPQDIQALQNTGKALTTQLKKETRQLEKQSENANS